MRFVWLHRQGRTFKSGEMTNLPRYEGEALRPGTLGCARLGPTLEPRRNPGGNTHDPVLPFACA
jgi:hypothetical protein